MTSPDAGSHHHHGGGGSPSQADENTLLLRARCAELELRLAKQAELIADLRSTGSALNQSARHSTTRGGAVGGDNNNDGLTASGLAASSIASALGGTSPTGGSGSGSVRDQFTLQRENGMLVEKNKSLEAKLQVAHDSLQSLQQNLAREVSRAQAEGERHAQQLRQQLIEAQEHATTLQEKIVGLLGKDAAMRNAGLDELTTENIFITTDSVLHRLQTDRKLVGAAARSKFDVSTEFRGRTLALTGRRINVLTLKSEILGLLNECYANLAGDPTQRIDALRSKDSATKSELEHLRRTIATQEQTISSLHTALHTANEKAARTTAEAEVAKRDSLVHIEKVSNAQRMWDIDRNKLQREVESLKQMLQDQSGVQAMSVQSLQKEVGLSLEVRDELDRTRTALENALAAKESAERLSFSASQQVAQKDGALESLLHRATKAEAAAMRLTVLEQELTKAEQRNRELSSQLQHVRSEAAEERGRANERMARLDNEVGVMQTQLEDVSAEKLALEELLRKMEEAASNWNNFVTVVGRSAVTAATTPSEIVALSQSAATRVTRLEEENRKLREELQRAFEDMKTVATALRDTKTARENTLQLCDKLEMEKLRFLEEKKQLNDDLIAQRMQSRTREGEHTMKIQQLQHEVAFQKSRVDTIHQEYQKRIAAGGPSGSAAAALLGGNATTTDTPVRSISENNTNSNAGGKTGGGEFSVVPNPAAASSATDGEAAATSSNAGGAARTSRSASVASKDSKAAAEVL